MCFSISRCFSRGLPVGTWLATQACALTELNQQPFGLQPVLNPLSYTSQGKIYFYLSFLKDFIYFRGEGKRDINWLPLSHPQLRPGLQCRHVPWQGIELATFWFAGQCPTHWTTPVRAHLLFFPCPCPLKSFCVLFWGVLIHYVSFRCTT